MTSPLPQLLGSLSSRVRSARRGSTVSGSGTVLALLGALRRGGSLVGFRRRPDYRLGLLFRVGVPSPLPLPGPQPRSRRQLAALSPTTLVGSSSGVQPASNLVRNRRGGLPLLLPFGR